MHENLKEFILDDSDKEKRIFSYFAIEYFNTINKLIEKYGKENLFNQLNENSTPTC